MRRAVAKLIVEAALIAAERPPGESIGVFLPVPDNLGFPEAGDHNDDPHVTVLFIGAVPNGKRDILTKTVQEIVGGHPPLKMKIDDEVSYFDPSESSDGKRVAKLGVSAEGLEDLHKEIWEEVEAAGIKVEHSFPDFKPHITLDYIEPDESYAGEAPTGGGWTANAFELWGWGDPIELPFTAEVTAGGRHWSDLPSNVPKDVRDELEEAIEFARDNAYDTVRGNRNSFDPTQYDDFWEDMVQEFVWDLYDHVPDKLADGFDKVKARLHKPGALLKKIKRAPKEYRSTLLQVYNDLLAKETAEWKKRTQDNPDSHPDFDFWWKGSISLEDASDEAKEWAGKLELW